MKILLIFGTRPEAIKIAPVITALRKTPGMELVICNTGQHRELADQVIDLFNIKPDFSLHVMKPNQSLISLTTELLNKLDQMVKEVNPDWILAQGDTTSVMCASIIAHYNKILFGHIEAGLRTYDKFNPYPEEINRRIAGVIADLHFAPTIKAKEALLRENVNEKSIKVTGNTIIDALRFITKLPSNVSENDFPGITFNKKLILVTAHRRENFGEPFMNICKAIRNISLEFKDVQIVFPVHLNPNIKQIANEILNEIPGVSLIKPVNYEQMLFLMNKSYLIMTDSGGIQEEAPSFKKPLLVLRNTTERPEGVEAGIAKLIGTETNNIIMAVSQLLKDQVAYSEMIKSKNPYGDGYAAEKIVNALISYER
jgi:UDP-N-acetylglucosamine 2-epimerase (non-hydrolysing)